MRLIDADALKGEIEFHPTSVSVCMTVEQARGETNFKLRCLEDIDNAPTVAAIPVKWLKKQFYDNPNSQWAEKCRDVFTGWQKWQSMQKEQEAR